MATHVFTSSIIIHSRSDNSLRESDFKFKLYILNYLSSFGRPFIVFGFVALIMDDLCIINYYINFTISIYYI